MPLLCRFFATPLHPPFGGMGEGAVLTLQALVAFKPRLLKNLMLYDEMPSLSPIIDMKVRAMRGTSDTPKN